MSATQTLTHTDSPQSDPVAVQMAQVDLIVRAQNLVSQGLAAEAVLLYRSWLTAASDPQRYVAWFNLGTLLGSQGRHLEAEGALRQAIALNPVLFQARLNLGHQLEHQNRRTEAVAEWLLAYNELAATARPDQALTLHALNNLARVLEDATKYDQARHFLELSLQTDPKQSDALQHHVHLRQKECLWPVYQSNFTASEYDQLISTSPLAMLAAHDDPALQLLVARKFIESKVRKTDARSHAPMHRDPPADDRRIRIGYLSGDFCMHAVGLLTVELFELHDRQQFEVHGYCWSREDGTALRTRIVNAFDHFTRIGMLSDQEAAARIKADGIDVLVDLQGLTSGTRPDILSHRPATVQLSYLGFPGTTALDSVDYVIGDAYVLPSELEPYMSEAPLRLPHCFQVSDRKRPVGPTPERSDYGLPQDAVVFASFNNTFKITQPMFEAWTEILRQVPRSVLWLLADNPWAKANLMSHAQALGIAADRIVFATRVAPPEYLARIQLVDLYLDTFPYNAGTTASDVLWMGRPIVTLSGKTFVSRMAGGLLTAAGLPELITNSIDQYVRLAVNLGKQPQRLASLKRYLTECRDTMDLFNMPMLVEDLESAFQHVLTQQRYKQRNA